MARLTYYIVLPFFRTSDGDVLADEPIEVSDADRARRQAERVARSKGGAIAFSRSGDPVAGDFDNAVILASFGEVPNDLSTFTSS